jgi:hypothetical protein
MKRSFGVVGPQAELRNEVLVMEICAALAHASGYLALVRVPIFSRPSLILQFSLAGCSLKMTFQSFMIGGWIRPLQALHPHLLRAVDELFFL